MKKEYVRVIAYTSGCGNRNHTSENCMEGYPNVFDCPDLPRGEFPKDCPLKTVEE